MAGEVRPAFTLHGAVLLWSWRSVAHIEFYLSHSFLRLCSKLGGSGTLFDQSLRLADVLLDLATA